MMRVTVTGNGIILSLTEGVYGGKDTWGGCLFDEHITWKWLA